MRKFLTPILPTILFIASCNPKERIVNRQRAIKNEFETVDKKVLEFYEREKKLDNDEQRAHLAMVNNPDTSEVQSIRRKIFSNIDSLSKYKDVRASLSAEYDSLEMELKKY